MHERLDREIAGNPLVGGLPTDKKRSDEFYVRHPKFDTVMGQVRGCLTGSTGIAGVSSGLGKSCFGRYARAESSDKEVGVSHRAVVADIAKKMFHHRESVGGKYLVGVVDAEIDFDTFLETLKKAYWSRKSAFAEQFRLPQGEYLGMDAVRDRLAYREPGRTADGRDKSEPALCRQWADLDRYSALQAHFDARDAQLSYRMMRMRFR
jgi:hypothetical protein